MATLAARGSGTPVTSGTTWAALTNAVDGTAGTNPATYATYTNATASAVGYIEIGGYDFATSVGASDTLNSVTVSLRHFENNTGRFASVRFQPYDGATAIGTIFTATLATGARNDSTTFPVTLAQLRSSTFKVRVTITGAASTQSRVESIDYVDVTADYTPVPPSITQAAYRFYADGTETGATAYTTTATLADSYPATNQDNIESLAAGRQAGQSFLGNGQPLARIGFRLSRSALLPGNVTAYLYAHTGTFGDTGTVTGSALATSTTVLPYSSLTQTTTPDAWYYFDFDGTYTLNDGTPYVVVVGGDFQNTVYVAADFSSASHAGSRSLYNGTTWGANVLRDLIFEVYTNGYAVDTSSGDVNLQVRTRLQSTNAVAVPAADDWQLQWERNTSGTWADVTSTPAAVLADNSAGSTTGSENLASSAGNYALGQSFTGNGGKLVQSAWWTGKSGAPPGNVYAELYAHSGTFGTSSVPTGAPLATSTTRLATSLSTSLGFVTFDFDSTLTLAAGTKYVIVLTVSVPGDASNFVVGSISTTAAHAGNRSRRDSGGTWIAVSATFGVQLFQIYETATPPVFPHNSANLTDAAATTNRLGAGTGTFVAGKVSEDGLVDNLGWTANNHTEVLYSVTLKQANLTPTDTLRFRVLRNGATTGLTYTQYPSITIGSAGPTDRTGVATGSITLAGTATGTKEVTATATGTLTVAGTASGSAAAAPVLGTATGTLTVAGVAQGVHGVAGTATGTLTVAGVASGQKTVTAVVSGSVTIAGTAVGTKTVTATATGQLTVAGVAAGLHGVTATATGSITLAGTASGQKTATATATGFLELTGTASGVRGRPGVATGSITVTGTASGQKTIGATATGQVTLAGTASGQKIVGATGTGQIVVAGHALGLVEGNAVGFAAGSIVITGLATGRRGTTATATGTLTIQGLATATKTVTGTVTGSISIAGTATGAAPVAFEIVGEWNDQAVDALQWGTDTVVEWFMLTAVQVNATATGGFTLGGVATGIGETPAGTIPTIVTSSTESGPTLGVAPNPIPAPAGIVAGNLLVCFASNDAPVTTELTGSTGWTRLVHATQGANVHRGAMFARLADGGANDTFSLAGGSVDYCCSIHRITGHAVANVSTDIYFASAASSSDGNADPPAVDAGSSHPFLWIAACILDANVSTITAVPAGYTQVANMISAPTGSSSGLAVAWKGETTATQDPGTFTNSTPPWIAITVGVPG